MARSRYRSVRYDLSAAVEVARLVESAGDTIAADILAPALGYSGTNNGAYLARVASARLFGVVTGRGSRFEATERGRRILAGAEPDASTARREAFLAVPLFRAVADAAARQGGLLPADLVSWLEGEFGETSAKSQTVADRLIASAAQAGVLKRVAGGKYQLTAPLTNFTSVDKPASPARTRQVRWRRAGKSPSGEDAAMAENGLWLDDEPVGSSHRIPAWRRAGVIAAAAVVLIVVAVPVALVAAGSPSPPTAAHKPGPNPRLGNGPAEHQVLSALSATTNSGNFDFSYTISSTPASHAAPTTPTTACDQIKVPVPGPSLRASSKSTVATMPLVVSRSGEAASASSSGAVTPSASSSGYSYPASGGGTFATGTVPGSGSASTGPVSTRVTPALPPGFVWKTEKVCNGPIVSPDPVVQGGGVINTQPLAMVASANIGNGLNVSVRIDGSDVYEGSSGDTGLAPLASDASASGTNLPGFAGITEGTLGTREGAVAMMGMASPTGYLDLIQPAIDAAAKTGTGVVDGTPVTVYQVANNLDQLAAAAGTTGPESQTISAALILLKGQGYTANSSVVSIDAAGYIRQVKSTDTFGDGGSVTLQATFSNFGCAGTVLMPGQTGSGTPPNGCTSPDGPKSSPAAPKPSTSTASQATTPSTSSSQVTSTTPTTVASQSPPTTASSTPPGSTSPSTGSTTTTTAASGTTTSSVP